MMAFRGYFDFDVEIFIESILVSIKVFVFEGTKFHLQLVKADGYSYGVEQGVFPEADFPQPDGLTHLYYYV